MKSVSINTEGQIGGVRRSDDADRERRRRRRRKRGGGGGYDRRCVCVCGGGSNCHIRGVFQDVVSVLQLLDRVQPAAPPRWPCQREPSSEGSTANVCVASLGSEARLAVISPTRRLSAMAAIWWQCQPARPRSKAATAGLPSLAGHPSSEI